jgi:hypothetical protein
MKQKDTKKILQFRKIDKNLLSWEESLGISVLYVKEILVTRKC